MGRNKEQFIEETGGLRIGETPEQFKLRLTEIKALAKWSLSPGLSEHEREKAQRRLCELKGIDFDSHDDED